MGHPAKLSSPTYNAPIPAHLIDEEKGALMFKRVIVGVLVLLLVTPVLTAAAQVETPEQQPARWVAWLTDLVLGLFPGGPADEETKARDKIEPWGASQADSEPGIEPWGLAPPPDVQTTTSSPEDENTAESRGHIDPWC